MSPDPGSREPRPFGSWATPLTSAAVVESIVGLRGVRAAGETIIWEELRPSEGGRTQLVARHPDGRLSELLGPEFNVRTAVHEYGGGAWWTDGTAVWLTDWDTQRLHRLELATGELRALTPEPAAPRGDRYADGDTSPDGRRIVCVRERHPADGRGAIDVRNEIVCLAADEPSDPEVLVSGPDFVAAPRFSPDGGSLCWVQWDHPNMPWDDTRLYVRETAGGSPRLIAGGEAESVAQPAWQPDGSLLFISDRTGWWNLYRWSPSGGVEPLAPMDADLAVLGWLLGESCYAVLGDGGIVFARCDAAGERLSLARPGTDVEDLDLRFSSFASLRSAGRSLVGVAGAPDAEPAVVRLRIGETAGEVDTEMLRAPRDLAQLGLGAGDISAPQPITFRSPDRDGTAHALFYAPASARCTGPAGERPPLLVVIHGGPTAAASPAFALDIQYWTTRGFAVVDVDYAGSTGHGRAYRELLKGNWGIADVSDCVAAVRWLADEGLVDPTRMCIRGGSAGGFTTLAALARRDTPFAAGADYFGVADLEALARDTHKFESRYLDGLVAPYPEGRDIYAERSPLTHVDALARPLIVLQGLEDEIVPPNQSEMIVGALRAKRVPVAYLAFEGEQHGFRRADTLRRALDAELSFYAQVLGFPLPEGEAIEPVAVENLPAANG